MKTTRKEMEHCIWAFTGERLGDMSKEGLLDVIVWLVNAHATEREKWHKRVNRMLSA